MTSRHKVASKRCCSFITACYNSSLPSPLPHTNPTLNRLPQKALTRPKPPLLPQLELIPPPHSRHNERKLHLRDVPSHTRPRPIRKRYERPFLLLCQVFRVPAVGVEEVGVEGGFVGGVPDGGEVVDGVGGDGEDGALWEVVVADGDAGAGGHDAG